MLDALAVERHQVFLDLPGALRRLLVERDANATVRRGHRLREQAGVLALDVEVANLAEVEDPLVEIGPEMHAAAVDVVGQVIDLEETASLRVPVDAIEELEIDVIDGGAALITVDQVQRRSADALDGRQAELHRAGRNIDRLSAQLERAVVGFVRVAYAKRHAAGRRTVFLREIVAARLFGSRLMMKLISPWRYSVTSFER